MQEDSNFGSSTVSFCPSFSTYASQKIVDIADKVTQERDNNGDVGDIEEEDFEFVSLGEGDACQLVIDGQIRQVFPVFNRDLMLNNGDGDGGGEGSEVENLLMPLRNLFVEDREDGPPSSSSSSSEADELEGLPEETYCVWVPNRNPDGSSSSNKCKKSNSTGSSSSSSSSSSSKGWLKFRDLLKRSNSDGKESFIFIQKPKINAESKKSKESSNKVKVKAKAARDGKVKVVSAHETFYVKNRAVKQGDKKKSYLPYRQDLVGIFTGNYVSSLTLGKTFPPF